MRTWRTKAAKALMANCRTSKLDDALSKTVLELKKAALTRGLVKEPMNHPYDPVPIALVSGANAVRAAELCCDGRIVWENDHLIVEYDSGISSAERRRFTIAHEAGHLVLWAATGRVTRVRPRKTAMGSEIEELCNKIAAEILAPREEIRLRWRAIAHHERSASDFILLLSDQYQLSLNFAAIRFREICSPRRGVALLNLADKCFEWAHHIDEKSHVLRGVLQEVARRSAIRGGGSYSRNSATGIELVPFEWHRFSAERVLVLTGRA